MDEKTLEKWAPIVKNQKRTRLGLRTENREEVVAHVLY